jgi:hypothetical protein
MSIEQQDAEARGDLAQAMVVEATGLVVAVREETRQEIAQRLSGLDRTELEALAVVLAALVDPEQHLHTALGWVDFDEYGDQVDPYVPRKDRRWTAREKAQRTGGRPAPAPRVRVDWHAVDRALAGHSMELTQAERIAAVDVGIRLGMSKDQVAEALGMEREAVGRAWERIKERARKAGVFVPAEPVGEITPHRVPREDAA